MSDSTASRRSFLKAAGGVVAATAGGAALVNESSAATAGWSAAESPTSKTIYGVSMTADGPYAAGKDGNLLSKENGSWEKTVAAGPHTRNNSLRTIAVTDDGKRVWFAGASGALGAFDVDKERKIDYSAPNGMTSTWEGITLTGKRDQETIYVSNGSGEVLKGIHDADGCVQWQGVTEPGGGSRMPAIDFQEANTGIGHAVDTSQGVYETTDAGDTWSKVGISESQVGYYDVASFVNADGEQIVYVAGGDGKVYRLNCTCDNWTPLQVSDKTLRGVTHQAGARLAVGAAGRIHEKPDGGNWQRLDSPVTSDLYEVAYGGSDYADVAVGASGTILER